MKYRVIVPGKTSVATYDDVRDARIELNWHQDRMCRPGTNHLRSLNPQCAAAYIEAVKEQS